MPSRKLEVALTAARRTLQSTETASTSEAETAVEAAVAEIARVPGLGPARARRLHQELGVGTLEELAAAAAARRVSALHGFGPVFEARLRTELDALLSPAGRMPLPDAEVHLQRLLQYMQRAPGIEHVEVAGSYRRRCATLGDIDLLAVSARPAGVMRYFTTYADAASASAVDASRGSLTLNCGLRVELRVAPRRCHGATLHYLTGSSDYNTAVRALGLDKGVRVSEYGVFALSEGKAGARRLGGQREEDVFEALDMQWVPPELRENTGEIEAAVRGRLPPLVEMSGIRGDFLRARIVGDDSLAQLVRSCGERGYAWCVVADAAQPGAHSRRAAAVREQRDAIDTLRAGTGVTHVVHAVEVLIDRDGTARVESTDRDAVDLVIGTVPSAAGRPRDRSAAAIITAVESGSIDILSAVPTLTEGITAAAADAVLRAAAAHGVPLLLPLEPAGLALIERIGRRAHDLGATVLLGSCASSVAGLDRIRFVVDQARRGWLGPAEVLNTAEWTRPPLPRGPSRRQGQPVP